ncbi:MAG: hypothetical protein NTY51_09170 [Deltaproteobacteria bacterium]|nr:hypothetical protein [Deltaproteobacteria bacterium]
MTQLTGSERLTIRQACRLVYPFVHLQTVYLWIRERVFTPVALIQSRSGPGGGTELDFSDLTTMGLLHCIFQSGVKYNQIVTTNDRPEFRANGVQFWQRLERSGRIIIEPLLGEPIWGRQLQEFLEFHNYNVTIYMKSSYRIDGPSLGERNFNIWICGGMDQWMAWRLFEERGDNYGQAVAGHFFIMARDWQTYVQERLRLRA